jgi:hypothetical protein
MQTLTEGSEWKKPNQGASVKAHAVGRLQDGAVFEDADLDFVTDEGEGKGACMLTLLTLCSVLAGICCGTGSCATLTMAIAQVSPSQFCGRQALRLHSGRLTQGGTPWLQSKCRRGWTWRCKR